MTAAPFVWRADGRPDWASMWTSFCELAVLGGPPHRGPEQALRGTWEAGAPDPAMVAEIRRGIWETTALFAEAALASWLAVTCESREMAAWLGAAIVPENVEAHVEDDRVLLPLGPHFRLEHEAKSVITVVAKTHHYWVLHLERPADESPKPRLRYRFRCPGCGLDFYVARRTSAAHREATCPADGTSMESRGPVHVSGTAVPGLWHSHGPGQPYHSHATEP